MFRCGAASFAALCLGLRGRPARRFSRSRGTVLRGEGRAAVGGWRSADQSVRLSRRG